MVRKIIALIMGIVILNASTELHQLARLPLLIKHYIHHQQEDPTVSIFIFLKDHYINSQHPNDNDDQQDNQLPFKSTGELYHIDIGVIEKKIIITHAIFPIIATGTYHPEGIPSNRPFSIFHPPQWM